MIDLRALQGELLVEHGPQGWWWPGEEPFEIAVGAVLVQRSRWEQADLSIIALRAAGLLDPGALADADEEIVRELVRGSGFPTSKPRRLQALARWVEDRGEAARSLEDAALRAELLEVEGIGEETADVIGLYCFGRPAFVCDEYARRVLRGRGAEVPGSYPAFRREIAPTLERADFTVAELAELHGLLVEEGKLDSKKRASTRRVRSRTR
ncbi:MULTISPECIES: endonuclease III domain-containing protein [unclassified Brachybacterium]|uniref:endonuclease III domain-containing protein n=1 Tax=unclassified Brachybacterium TaxID=2623841 RepID=UPI0040348994